MFIRFYLNIGPWRLNKDWTQIKWTTKRWSIPLQNEEIIVLLVIFIMNDDNPKHSSKNLIDKIIITIITIIKMKKSYGENTKNTHENANTSLRDLIEKQNWCNIQDSYYGVRINDAILWAYRYKFKQKKLQTFRQLRTEICWAMLISILFCESNVIQRSYFILYNINILCLPIK